MTICDNEPCSRQSEFVATYGFKVGPRLQNRLCGPCKAMLLEGSHAVNIEVET